MMSDAQTAYATAIMFGLYADEAQKQVMGERLAELTRAAGYRIGTGFVGTPLITDALTQTGHLDAATRLLTQTENPSWLYPVTMGATTIWERWDSMLEDGSINPGEMTSFNHYALGAVADWLHRSVAGLAPAEPGYRVIRIAPQVLDGFEYASARHETPYGLATSGWVRNGDAVTVAAIVPANATAEVILPGSTETITVGSGDHEWVVSLPGSSPAEVAGQVSPASTLAEIVDDPEAYATVWQTLAASDEHAAAVFRRHTKWTTGRTLAEPMHQFPPRVQKAIAAALDELNTTRAGKA
jgi:alpha-L-rhamnosidase